MATKTYIELVNDVLVRLREDTVGTISASKYSALIGKWVNDAKMLVEDSWDWQCLIQPASVFLFPGVQDYPFSGVNERARLMRDVMYPTFPLAFDVTTGDPFQLIDRPYDWIRTQRNLLAANPSNQEKPIYFGMTRVPGGTGLGLYEVPTSIRQWAIYLCSPQNDLAFETDVLNIPYSPVVEIALLYALNERGEEIGEPGTTVQQKASVIVGNAVALDAQNQPHKTTFFPG